MSGTEDGSQGRLVAFDIDEPTDFVEVEHACRQTEDDRGVRAHDSIESSTIVRADL